MKGAFNSPGFLFFSPSFFVLGTGVTILVCRHKYKYNSGFGWGCGSSNTPVILEKRFIQGAFNSPIFGHVDISKQDNLPKFQENAKWLPRKASFDDFLQVGAKMNQKIHFIKEIYSYENLGAFNCPDTTFSRSWFLA